MQRLGTLQELETRITPAAPGLVPVGTQPVGGLSGKIAYIHGGHGITADNLGTGSWSFQRGETNEMIEDLGNVEQMTFLADYLFRAGATVVPLRPIGHQVNEVVLDNDDAGVTFSGGWTDSTTGLVYYGTAGDVRYKSATTSVTETAFARYKPTIAVAGYYPVYAWASSGSNRSTDQLYRVNHAGGITEVTVNHRRVGNGLVYLGTYYFNAGTGGFVDISNRSATAGNAVIADMIRFGNGMGSIDRGGGVSGRPREDEAGLYWIQWHVDHSQGISSSEYRATTDDRDATVGASLRFAEYMNREADGALKDRVFVSYHSNAGGGRGTVGLHNGVGDPNSTPNQYLLANTLGTEVNADMVAQAGVFENNWNDRGTNVTYQNPNFAYGEINNSVINDEFDATILEVAFHDDLLDAELMRDPKVRDAVARATYQGLVKYFRAVDGNTTSATQIPGVVSAVRAVSNTPGSVTLTWTAPASSSVIGSAATSYRIYSSTNGPAFDGGTAVAGTTATLSGYNAATPYYFKVVAVNTGGESEPSEVMAVLPAGTSKTVLIVNGFDRLDRTVNPTEPYGSGGNTIERVRPLQSNSRDYTVQVATAISASRPGLRFDSTSNEAVISGAVNLNSYAAVIWILGEESTVDHTFDASERTKVEQFIAQGGHLFLSGSEIGWDLQAQGNGVSFFQTTLKGNYVSDDANSYSLNGTASGIFTGLSFSFDNGTLFYNAEYPDVINPQSGATAALTYSTGGNAAIQAPGTGGRGNVVMLGFPFETITTAANRSAVLGRVFTYFGISLDSTVPAATSITTTSSNGTYSTGQTINVTLNFSELVILTGTMNVTLNSGATLIVPGFTGTTAAATYTIQAGQTTPDLTVGGITLGSGATLKDLAGNSATLSLPSNNLGTNANLIVNPLPPTTISLVTINAGSPQRSRVTSLTLTFATPVNAALLTGTGAITLTRTSGGSAVTIDASNGLQISPTSGMVTTLTLTFANVLTTAIEYGSLADGRWQLAIPYLSYTSPNNDPNLRRLFGDINTDLTVNGSDLVDFGNVFGSNFPAFDFDNNGTINGADLVELGNRFGTSV
ncbi:hypothetical protein BH11PLA2_BH11PLA2_44340 [soil metagenome]